MINLHKNLRRAELGGRQGLQITVMMGDTHFRVPLYFVISD